MFLIDDDQLQARQRHEDGQPGAEHDLGAPRQRLDEAAGARRIGHAAVGADDVGAGEARRDAAFELGGERDLRHQHQRLTAPGQHGVDRAQIDLGLAAAGDAVQQEGVEAVNAGYRLDRRLLRR